MTPRLSPGDKEMDKWAAIVQEAFLKYVHAFGSEPHGTLPQIKALLELGVLRQIEAACAEAVQEDRDKRTAQDLYRHSYAKGFSECRSMDINTCRHALSEAFRVSAEDQLVGINTCIERLAKLIVPDEKERR